MTAEDSVPLREYFEAIVAQMDLRYQQRFEAQTSAINAALQAAKEAVTKAEAATERRFEGVNEFRQTLSDQAGTFISRTEFNLLKERIDRNEGNRAGVGSVWVFLPVLIGMLVGIAGLVFAFLK